jgi:hypothetical protein
MGHYLKVDHGGLSYGLDDRSVGVQFPAGREIFFLVTSRPAPGPTPTSSTTGTGESFSGGKAAGA